MNNQESLLNSVASIVKLNNERYFAGDAFNIFKILKIESDEVRLHSRLLGELLNPQGSHGLGIYFLEKILIALSLNCELPKDLHLAKVEVEEFAGAIDENYTQGGRIDLVLKLPHGFPPIIIENKIFAKDQLQQLARYKTQYPNGILVYLTLQGNSPSITSLGSELNPSDIHSISYANHIKNCLENCLKVPSIKPQVKETLEQYLQIVLHLTDQSNQNKMSNDIVDTIIKLPEHIKAAEAIAENWRKVQFKIVERISSKLKEEADKLELKFESSENLGVQDSSIVLYKLEWNFKIEIYFETELNKLLLGINYKEAGSKLTKEEEIKKLLDNNYTIKNGYTNWIWVERFKAWEETGWSEVETKIPDELLNRINFIIDKLK